MAPEQSSVWPPTQASGSAQGAAWAVATGSASSAAVSAAAAAGISRRSGINPGNDARAGILLREVSSLRTRPQLAQRFCGLPWLLHLPPVTAAGEAQEPRADLL